MPNLFRILCMLMSVLFAAYSAEAGQAPRPLYDLSLDMDGNGMPERAVLVLNNPQDGSLNDASREIYMLGPSETVDLFVYMDAGATTTDIIKPPQFRKNNIVDRDRFNWVGKLESNGKQSLKLYASYAPGSTATEDETLTVIYRNSHFLVAGLDLYWEGGGNNGNCQYNFLTSRGYTAPGEFAADKTPIKAKVKPVALDTWSPKTRPQVCDRE